MNGQERRSYSYDRIAIRVMVDASVVMVENLHKHRERDHEISQAELVIWAANEVGPALSKSRHHCAEKWQLGEQLPVIAL